MTQNTLRNWWLLRANFTSPWKLWIHIVHHPPMELKSTKMFQSAFEFNPSFIHYRVHSHRSGKPWKTTHGTRSETNGKTMENHGTPHGKPVENPWKTYGKPLENHWKPRKTNGKPEKTWKTYGKPWRKAWETLWFLKPYQVLWQVSHQCRQQGPQLSAELRQTRLGG